MRCSSMRRMPGATDGARSRSGRWRPARGARRRRSNARHEALRRRRADAARLAARCRCRYRCRRHDRAGRARMRARDGAERVAGPLLPGMPNLHSHAFQRALAGRTGHANADGDSFWTWRQRDVRVSRPDRRRRVRGDRRAGVCRDAEGRIHGGRRIPLCPSRSARQALRRSGGARASHRRCRARRRASRSRCCRCSTRTPISAARRRPTGQRRFVHTVDSFARLVASLARDAAAAGWTLGIAPHSLRAVTPDELAAIVALVPRGAPIHIHAAEQQTRGCGVRGMERRAAGRMAAGARADSMRAGASCTRRT